MQFNEPITEGRMESMLQSYSTQSSRTAKQPVWRGDHGEPGAAAPANLIL
jgi:hypothetical protein